MKPMLLALVLALLAAAPAAAQTVDRGATTFELSRSAASALKQAGVTVTVGRPARRVSTAVVLPVARGILSGTRYLEHSGTLGFKRGTRRIVFRDLRTALSSSRASVSGVVAGKRVALLSLAARRPAVSSSAGTALLPATKATLTARAATLVRRALKLKRLSRALGTVNVNAALRGRATTGSGPSAAPGGTTSTPGGSTTTPGTPTNTKVFVEPPLPPRPGDAATVSGATIDFAVRPSWIGYLASGNGESDGTIVGDGATESGGPPATNFGFPHAGPSWVTPLDATGLYFGGTLRFSHPAHGIEIVLKNPEIELNGASSRAIFRVDGPAITAESRGKRAVLFDLNLAAASRSTLLNTTTYADIPVTVTADAADGVFGGMYKAGDDYGTMTVSFTR